MLWSVTIFRNRISVDNHLGFYPQATTTEEEFSEGKQLDDVKNNLKFFLSVLFFVYLGHW